MSKLLADISLVIVLDKILSENTLYTPTTGYRGNKHFSYLRLSPEGREYKGIIECQLNKMLTKTYRKQLTDLFSHVRVRTETSYKFYLSDQAVHTKKGTLKKGDVTNMVKAFEDSIFKILSCGNKTFDDCTVSINKSQKIPVLTDRFDFTPRVQCQIKIFESIPEEIILTDFPEKSSLFIKIFGDN